MGFIPHTKEDIRLMTEAIGINDPQELFDEIPNELRFTGQMAIPENINELQLHQLAAALSKQNTPLICFAGAGSYDHYIPSAVWNIATRGEFLTSYTPYQAEASQGTLQLLYEYQTMIAELTGMDVSNASLYDGASALAEAVLMASRLHQSQSNDSPRVLVPATLHPFYRNVLESIVQNQQIELITVPFDKKLGITDINALTAFESQNITALVIPQPNFFGCLEDVDALTNWAKKQNAIAIACVNPTMLALLKSPKNWGETGVDIVCGEGQPLGIPMASGGPYFGFLATKMPYVRQMPGRVVGKTVDKEGRPGFVLTLQAREQHIRRAKATSNICTNQGLLVTAATIYMSLMGSEGLRDVAIMSHQQTKKLVHGLKEIQGISLVFSSPFAHDALIQFDTPIEDVLKALENQGILGGYAVQSHYPELKNTLLISATEKRTDEEIETFLKVVKAEKKNYSQHNITDLYVTAVD